MQLLKRRARNLTLTAVTAILAYQIFEVIDLSIAVQQYYSGWLMIFLMLVLFSYFAKKRLSVLPLGTSSNWVQWHYYLGVFLVATFLIHIELSIPQGFVDVSMALAFIIVIGSGICGAILNRILARRLAYIEDEIIYERIGEQSLSLKKEVEEVILDATKISGSTTLSDYYLRYLDKYFLRPRFSFAHLFASDYAYLRMQDRLGKQLRYLNKEEAEKALAVSALLHRKNVLDQHYTLQAVLKYWGVSHYPVALILIILVMLHIVLVYAFRGAM